MRRQIGGDPSRKLPLCVQVEAGNRRRIERGKRCERVLTISCHLGKYKGCR